MNRFKKTILLLTILILTLNLTACDEDASKQVVITDYGVLIDIIDEEGQGIAVFKTSDQELKLTTEDESILNSLNIREEYAFSHNEEKELLSLTMVSPIEDNLNEEAQDPKLANPIPISESKPDISNLSLVDSYEIDFTEDGNLDVISLYTSAEKDESGELLLDDGQNWTLIAHTSYGDYLLFQDYIQLGSLDFYIASLDNDFYIITVNEGTANLNITEFKFNPESKTFHPKEAYSLDGNVNMIYST